MLLGGRTLRYIGITTFIVDLGFALIVIGLLTMTITAAEMYETNSGSMLADFEIANSCNLASCFAN